jgi:tetratricopeptide (TPR) repeat protein
MANPSKKQESPPVRSRDEMAESKEILPGKSSGFPWPTILQVLVIVAATLWIYWPALHGDWLWDDDLAITGNSITQSPTGLSIIWFEPGRQLDYYPVKSSVQWLQWRLWGMDTLGYHLTNIFLHTLSAFLVWRLLGKFHLRLAWLGGLIFAIHPVQVESVAWIAELKNTLSLPPILLAMCAWIDFDERGRRKDYWLALGLFVVAMLCKLSVVLFPLVILLHAWWRRGRIGWIDLKTSAPFFVVSLLLGLVAIVSGTYDVRLNQVDADVMPVSGFLARMVVAGLSLSFYFSKSFLPVGLLPIYPKWTVDPSSPIQFLPWLILGGLISWLWTIRHGWGRHALLGLGFFLLNLAPCPGLIPTPNMSFAWVMDHFLYLPIIGLIGLVMAGMGHMEIRLSAPFRACGIGVVTVVLALMAFASHGYATLYLNSETLWTYELRHNPRAWLAHNNLGLVLSHTGRTTEAIEQFEQALQLNSDYAGAHNNLGDALLQTEHLPEAMEQFEQALQIEPDNAVAHSNLGSTLLRTGRVPEAVAQLEQAVQLKPDYAPAHNNLGSALQQTGRLPDAIAQYEQAVQLKPDYVEARYNLGTLLLQTGRVPEAIDQYEQTLRIKPGYAEAHGNLGYALQLTGRLPEAIDQYELALTINPDYAEAHDNLGLALSQTGRTSEAIEQFEQALQIRPDFPDARNNLARLQALQKTAPPKN